MFDFYRRRVKEPIISAISFFKLARMLNKNPGWEYESMDNIKDAFDKLHPEIQREMLQVAIDKTQLHKLIWRADVTQEVIERFNTISNIRSKNWLRKYGSVAVAIVAIVVAAILYFAIKIYGITCTESDEETFLSVIKRVMKLK